MDQPITQEMDSGLTVDQEEKIVEKHPKAVKSGDFEKKLKTYPKRSSRNVPPKYYGWSSYNPLNWV